MSTKKGQTKPKNKPRVAKKNQDLVVVARPKVKTRNAFGIGYKNGTLSGYWAPTMNGFEDLMSPPAQLHSDLRSGLKSVAHDPKPDLKAEPFDEFVANITVGGDPTKLQVNNLFLNPGIDATFPLLSKILSQYERYAFDWLEFYIMPLDSGYGAPAGKFFMCADLGATLSFPSTIEDIQNNSIHVSGKVSKNLAIELAGVTRHSKSWFVRDGYLPAGADIRKFDLGKFFYGYYGLTSANPTGSIIGELHVRGICNGYDRYNKTTVLDPVFGSSLFSNYDCSAQSFVTNVEQMLNWNASSLIPTVSDRSGHELPGTAVSYSGSTFSSWTVERSGLYSLSGTVIVRTTAGTDNALVTKLILYKGGVEFLVLDTCNGNTYAMSVLHFERALFLADDTVLSIGLTCSFAAGVVTTGGSSSSSSSMRITALG